MARLEKHVRRAILFVNAKNVTGVKQSQFSPLLRRASGHEGEGTYDPWGPLDGRVINAGLRGTY